MGVSLASSTVLTGLVEVLADALERCVERGAHRGDLEQLAAVTNALKGNVAALSAAILANVPPP